MLNKVTDFKLSKDNDEIYMELIHTLKNANFEVIIEKDTPFDLYCVVAKDKQDYIDEYHNQQVGQSMQE